MKKLTTLTIADLAIYMIAVSLMTYILDSFVVSTEDQPDPWIVLFQLIGVVLVFAVILWTIGRLTRWRSHDMWTIALFTTTLAALVLYTGRLGTAKMIASDLLFWCLYAVVTVSFLVIAVGYDLIDLYPSTIHTGWLLVIAGVVASGIGLLRFDGEVSAWLFLFASLGTIAISIGLWRLQRVRAARAQMNGKS